MRHQETHWCIGEMCWHHCTSSRGAQLRSLRMTLLWPSWVSAIPRTGHCTALSGSSVECCLFTFAGFTTPYAIFKGFSPHLSVQPDNLTQQLPNMKQLYKPLHPDVLFYSEDVCFRSGWRGRLSSLRLSVSCTGKCWESAWNLAMIILNCIIPTATESM
jgi:hypothetical protein